MLLDRQGFGPLDRLLPPPAPAEALSRGFFLRSVGRTTQKAVDKIPVPFERLEHALEKQGNGPLFNGEPYSLVDAAYAPFLQRYFFLDRIKNLGHIEKFPRLSAWANALMKRPSTHSFPPDEFEMMYRQNVKRRNKWISQFVVSARMAAE